MPDLQANDSVEYRLVLRIALVPMDRFGVLLEWKPAIMTETRGTTIGVICDGTPM